MLHCQAVCNSLCFSLSTILPSLLRVLGLKAMDKGGGRTSVFLSYRESSSG